MGVQHSITYFPFVLGRIFLWVLRNLWHKILEADVVDILDDRLLHTDPLQLKKKKGQNPSQLLHWRYLLFILNYLVLFIV